MSTWEDRMAVKAKARTEATEAARRAAEDATAAELAARFPALPGESSCVIDYGPHAGHRTHIHHSHGYGVVTCEPAGLFSYVLPDVPPQPEPCPVCTARQQ